MLMDKVTEMVAHMIGIFHITLEEERMRDVYDKFSALKAKDPDLDDTQAVALRFSAKYDLGDFNPGLIYVPFAPAGPFVSAPDPLFFDALFPVWYQSPFYGLAANTVPAAFPLFGAGRPLLTLEPPSSVVVLTYQSAFLYDNDTLRMTDSGIEFVDPAVFLAELQQYEMIATAIAAPVSAKMVAPGETVTEDAIALHAQVGSTAPTTLTGVAATVLHGVDAIGLHVNGEAADEAPELADLMPAFMAPDDAEETATDDEDASDSTSEDAADDAAADYEFPDPFEGLGGSSTDNSLFEVDEGHLVVSGANLVVNEVSITTAWLDASVISVMGDVVNLNMISQINVLVDHDLGSIGEVVGSVAMNAATFAFTSTAPVPEEGAEASEDTGDLGLPVNWAVTRIDGDLFSVNQVSQYTFQTDNDIAEITFNGSNTYIGLGDNTVINLTNLSELGFGYDLIVVGGSMISINWINQINVLIDNDTMTYSGMTPTSMLGGDNLLFNGASITSSGVDAYGEMQDNFASAADSFADGATSINAGLAQDSVFEGIDILRVLYIEGDYTTINWIEQTNVLGDSDQVHLALDDFTAQNGGEVNVITGSNATINLATITDYGVDSNVMVGGEVYDDALLYQAELIDTDADPLGVDMPALASEAVVFLADDMLTPDNGPVDVPIVATAPESTASPDMMQTMLA